MQPISTPADAGEPPAPREPKRPVVAVVVLNWNGLADTRACVRSLLQQTGPAVEIHVVDNASDNGEADAVAAEFGDAVRLYRNAQNLGFAGGNNTAMDLLVAERRVDFIALLNNDAAAEPDWLQQLVAAAERYPGAGLLASHMVFWSDPETTENAGISILTTGEPVPRGRGQPRGDFTEPAQLLGACGGAVLYRTAALAEAGTFRSSFFANFEDADLSLRLVASGWECWFVPGAVVRHHLSQSIRKVRDDAFRVRSVGNMTSAYLLNMPWQVIALNLPWLIISWGVAPVAALFLGQWDLCRTLVRGRWRAVREARWIWRERRRLAPRRRGSWWRIWSRQRSFFGLYWRYFVDVVVRRSRRYME